MAVDQATKDYITTHFEEFTAKELAEKFKVSKSTVTRIIKGVRDDAAKMAESKENGAGAGAEEKKDNGENHLNDDFEWSPDTEERETIQLETDDGLHKLLKSAPQNDLTMAAEEEKAEEPDKGQVNQVMEQITEPDDEEINSLLSGYSAPAITCPNPSRKPSQSPHAASKGHRHAPSPCPPPSHLHWPVYPRAR